MSDCGCEPEGEYKESGDYALIKASSKTASTCGTPEDLNQGSPNCAKTDQTFDRLSSDFAFPSDQSVPVLVCDGSLYTVGQWIHFVNSKATVQVLSINANELTVRAVCSNGASVDGNPTAGTIIRSGDPIVAVRSPLCLTDSQKQDQLLDDLSEVTELELPNLSEQESLTAEIQPVGWTRSDSGNSGFKKSLKRILGVFFKGGSPYLTNLKTTDLSESSNYRRMVVNKSTKEVRQRLNLSEETSLQTGKTYITGVTNGEEALIPGFVFVPILVQIDSHGGNIEDETTWVQIPNSTPYVKTLNFSIAEIDAIDILGDKFYAELHFLFGLRNPSAFRSKAFVKVDGQIVGAQSMYFNVDSRQGFTALVPVDTTQKTVELKIEANANSGTSMVHLTTRVNAVYV